MKDVDTDPPDSMVPIAVICAADHPALEALRDAAAQRKRALREIDVERFVHDADAPGDLAAASHWIVAVPDEQVPAVLEVAIRQRACVGVLPAAGSVLPRLWSLPTTVAAQIDLALSDGGHAIDLTRCNGEIVLAIVALGDVPFLDHRGRGLLRSQTSVVRRLLLAAALFWSTFKQVFAIRPTALQLLVGDEEKPRRTAVTGLVVLEHDADKLTHALLGERTSARDGRLSALLLAPTSVVAYLAVLLRAAFGGSSLPRALSFLRTRRLSITADQPLAYRLDGRRRSAADIDFVVQPRALTIKVGSGFDDDNPVNADERDSLRLRTLPENEARLASIRGGLPLFTHALEEDFRELFLMLRDSARVTPDYLVQMIASVLLAGLGLILNSAAVIIGAMVLAPLMSPIVSLAMGTLRRDGPLLQGSLKTIITGVLLALFLASALAWLMPLRSLTAEMEARLHPSILDLGVAIIAGMAAAYAYARESVMKSMSGVAIAVALVPPLAVSGIGIGWGDGRVFGGAMLLFLTNLVGIAATAALTFLVMGYAPIRTAARGLRILALAVLAMCLPLYLSFRQIVTLSHIEAQLRGAPIDLPDRRVTLDELQVRTDDTTVVIRAVVAAPQWFTERQADQLKQALEARLQRPVRLELEQRLVR